MIVSKIDGTNCKNLLGLSIHLKQYSMTLIEYYVKYENFEIPKCKICSSDCQYRNGLLFLKTCSSSNCKKSYAKIGTPHTETSKSKIRKKRLEYLSKKSGKTAWESRASGKLSHLEQWFFNRCINRELHTKYDIVNEYSIFKYSIDFAFINEKIAVELDGKCHFVNGDERIQTDIEKDEYLIQNGWRVFRIRYDELVDSKIDELISFIGSSSAKNFDDKIYRNSEFKPLQREVELKKCGNPNCSKLHSNPKYCSKQCYGLDIRYISRLNCRKVERPSYEELKKDVWDNGYSAVGRKYGVSDNSIRKWIKYYEKGWES
jgi:very-short-patch-repair endonuclease